MTKTFKRAGKQMLSLLLSMIMVCFMMITSVSATSTGSIPADTTNAGNDYLTGGEFVQGIGNVTCLNKVDISLYPELYVAVHDAILDWDWHLSLINNSFQVDWNITDVTGSQTSAMIDFYAMSESEALTFVQNEFSFQTGTINLNFHAFTQMSDDNGGVDPSQYKWTKANIIFLWEKLDAKGCLYDYDAMKQTANHEIGHALGLKDRDDDQGVIMHYDKDTCTAEVATASDLANLYICYK